jgi:hypothetical protein
MVSSGFVDNVDEKQRIQRRYIEYRNLNVLKD